MSLQELRSRVLDEPALEARLSGIEDREAFNAACLAIAAELGLALDEAELHSARQASRRAWLERNLPGAAQADACLFPLAQATDPPPGAAWLPFHLRRGGTGVEVEWGYAGARRLTEPFLHQTLTTLSRHPFNEIFRCATPLAALVERARHLPGLPPAGFIFHMSRCGSTLAAQALAALPDAVALSEPEPLDALFGLLNENPGLADADHLALVRALVAALGQPRRAGDRRLFIKLDAWHMPWAGLLLQAFPETPWVFLYREPVEVLVSHQRMPGSQLIPGVLHPSFAVPPPDDPMAGYHPVEYGARVFSTILNAAEDAIGAFPGGRLANYSELPEALWTSLAGHFRLTLSPTEQALMEEACRHDAKEPMRRFSADSADKQRNADAGVKALARRWLDEPYQRLEAKRSLAKPCEFVAATPKAEKPS